MEVTAKLKSLRMSPRKVRLSAGLIRGQKVAAALQQLKFSAKWAAKPLIKLLLSAIANAKNNFGLSEDNLYVKTISVDGGRTLKRWLPRAHGRATPLAKRTSHINLILAEVTPTATKIAAKAKIENPAEIKERPVEAEGLKTKEVAAAKPATEEKDAQIVDQRREARGQHAKVEGGKRGFTTKVFRRKSG